MSLAKISPAFDQFLENFILYELTKDTLETTNFETKVKKLEPQEKKTTDETLTLNFCRFVLNIKLTTLLSVVSTFKINWSVGMNRIIQKEN